jgi:hypothetical protein
MEDRSRSGSLAEFILLLDGPEYGSKAKKCRRAKPAVGPYNLSSSEHKQVLKSFKVHGAHRFAENTVYHVHPSLSLRTFIPVGQFDQVVIEAKRAELSIINFTRGLCAKSIKVMKEQKDEKKKAMNAGANAGGGAGEGGGGQEDSQSKEKSQSMDQEFNKPAVMTPQFQEAKYHFYKSGYSWQAMVEGRMDTKGAQTKSYECNFSYSSDTAKSAQLNQGGHAGDRA